MSLYPFFCQRMGGWGKGEEPYLNNIFEKIGKILNVNGVLDNIKLLVVIMTLSYARNYIFKRCIHKY